MKNKTYTVYVLSSKKKTHTHTHTLAQYIQQSFHEHAFIRYVRKNNEQNNKLVKITSYPVSAGGVISKIILN